MGVAILVCGLRRSGTSMVGGVLNALGVPMGTSDLDGKLDWNESYFEDRDFSLVIQMIYEQHPTLRDGRNLSPHVSFENLENLLHRRCNAYDLWGAKSFAFAPILQEIAALCPHEVRVIRTKRPFGLSVVSYCRRYAKTFGVEADSVLMDQIKKFAYDLWLLDVNTHLYAAQHPERALEMDFNTMLEDPEVAVQNIAKFVGLEPNAAAVAAIRPEKRRY